MKKNILLFGLFMISISFTSMKNFADKTAYIHKVVVDVDESLLERMLKKDKNGAISYNRKYEVSFGEETDFENFSIDEVTSILKDFAETIGTIKGLQKVTAAGAKEVNLNNMFGNIVSNVSGKTKMQNFPNVELKKVKEVADEYYTIKMEFISVNPATLNKNYIANTLSFKVKTKITSTDKKGNILWENEEELKDFSSAFNNSDLPFNSEAEFFSITREPRLFNEFSNEPIGDYNSLSLEDIENCMKFALTHILSN